MHVITDQNSYQDQKISTQPEQRIESVWRIYASANEASIIASENGLAPVRRQAIVQTNVGSLLIRPLGTNFRQILIEIPTF